MQEWPSGCGGRADTTPTVFYGYPGWTQSLSTDWAHQQEVLVSDRGCNKMPLGPLTQKVALVDKAGKCEEKVLWIRFISVARRGGSLVYFNDLEDRYTVAGKGGGGKISEEEAKTGPGKNGRPRSKSWLKRPGSDTYEKLASLRGLA